MKKSYLLLIAIALSFGAKAQVLNESAGWPNEAWTITGSYATGPTAFESNPTTTTSFAFDDDDAVNGHDDMIAAESPIIDLTAAKNAGETGIEVTVDYGFRKNAAVEVLRFEYWDADGAAWVAWTDIPGNNTSVTDNFCTITKTNIVTTTLNIAAFTPTQLSGFRYRIFYDDNPAAAGWQYGFCFNSPTIYSLSCVSPNVTVSNPTSEGATFTWEPIDGVTGYEYVIDEVATAPADSGTPITATTYDATGLMLMTTYYFHVRTICTSGLSNWTTKMFKTTPVNDACSAPVELTVNSDFLCGTVTAGSLSGATDSGEGDNGAGTPSDDVWYTFVATSPSHRIVLSNIAGTPTDLVHETLAGSCGGFVSVLVSDANTSNPSGLVVGDTYYVRVFSYQEAPATSTTFNICVGTPPPPPANDTCATAIDLGAETSPLSSTTENAFNDNLIYCNNTSGAETPNTAPDTYYSISVPSGSTLTIGQTVNNYDSTNIVFYGDCDNRTVIKCFDDLDTQTVVWSNDTGSDQTVYWVQDGIGTSGTFTLAWSIIACTPPQATYTVNSLCTDSASEFEIVTNVTSMGSATSITVSDDQGHSQEITAEGPVTFGPFQNNTPVVITVTNNQNGDCVLTSATLNQTNCPPVNDNCATPTELTVNADYSCAAIMAGTLAAATDSGEGDNGAGTPSDDVWYTFVATSTTHRIVISGVAGTPTDLVHETLAGSCGGFTSVLVSDANTSNPTGLVVGDTYYVRVYSYQVAPATSTTFNICIGTPPPPPTNDNLADALALVCGETVTGSTELATIDENNAPDGGGADLDAPNVWYTYTGTGTPETITLNLCGSSYDTSVLVYTGSSGNLTFVAANDDASESTCGPGLGARSYLNFNSDGVTTYYITIEGWNVGTVGAYNMVVTCAPVTPPAVDNQTCASALDVPVDGTDTNSDNSFGDVTFTQPSCDTFGSIQDVWFSFVAPAGGEVDVTVTTAGMVSGNMNIYSGTCDALVPVTGTCNADFAASASENLTNLVEGNTYYVQVWSNFADQGGFALRVLDANLSVGNPGFESFGYYPNPVKNELNLKNVKNISDVSVYNILGQQVVAKAINATQTKIDMSTLSAGTYIVKVTSENQTKTFKVVKQ